MTGVDLDELGAAAEPDTEGMPFEEALGSLIRQAERDGVDLDLPRELDAVGEGTWNVEITKVRPGPSAAEVDPTDLSIDPGGPASDPHGLDFGRPPVE